jgi:hypothetical protein
MKRETLLAFEAEMFLKEGLTVAVWEGGGSANGCGLYCLLQRDAISHAADFDASGWVEAG